MPGTPDNREAATVREGAIATWGAGIDSTSHYDYSLLMDSSPDLDRPETVAVSEFKAKCLALLERVRRTGCTLVITKHGKPIAEVVPPSRSASATTWLGEAAGTLTITGDIVAPVSEPGEWEALRP